MRKLPVRRLSTKNSLTRSLSAQNLPTKNEPVKKRPTRKLLWAAVAGALFLPLQGFTLGLGEIEVNSALNQRLDADIELLSATAEDAEAVIIKLASRKDFSRAGLDRPYLLNDLQFKSIVVDGVPHINVSSGSPIREPFLNFLLDIDWPNGHLLREYTVLLDPPVFMSQPASASSSPVNQQAEADGGSDFRPDSGSSAIVPVVVPGSGLSSRPTSTRQNTASTGNTFAAAPLSNNAASGSYRVQSGDTAWSLADVMRPNRNVSVEQMMIAMLRANPESFNHENVNGLKRGFILRMPDNDQIASISQADAMALVREQAALWRQLSRSQSAGKPVSAMPADGMTPGAEMDAVDDGDNAHLAIVSAGSGSSVSNTKDPTQMSAAELRAELAYARERVETERVEKEALQQRVDSLETNVDAMKGMLSIEDDNLAGVQALNLPAGEGSDDAVAGDISADDAGLSEEEIVARQELLEALEGESAEDSMAHADTDAMAENADTEVVADDSAEAIFVDETDAAADDMPVDMPEQAEAVTPVSSPIVNRPEPDLLSKLLSDPILLAAAGGGLLFIVALIAVLIRRKKAAAEDDSATDEAATSFDSDDDFAELADELSAESDAVTDEIDDMVDDFVDAPEDDASDDFDSDATMVLDSADDTIITEAADIAEAEEEPRDDVIAEADVYLAYGIYQQAEELLTQAIADNPDRDDYRVKLAETHYAGKNVEGFVEVASEIRKRAGSDDVPAWKKVMGMGQDLCPDEAMFKGSMIGGVDVGSLAPKAPEMDFDLGISEGDDAVPDLDLSLDDELELPDMDDSDSDDADNDAMQETAILDADATQMMDASENADEIEFDINDTGAVEESSGSEDEFSLDIDASELDIDIQDEADEPLAEEESMEVGEIDIGLDDGSDDSSDDSSSDVVQDVDDIDIDFGLDDIDEQAPDSSTDDIEIDLSDEAESLDMDFNEMESAGSDAEASVDDSADIEKEAEIETTAVAAADVDDEDDFDLSSLDDVDEISTKLDLARAYIDMGDSEGAKGILDEVVAEGSDEQKKEASELMDKLD